MRTEPMWGEHCTAFLVRLPVLLLLLVAPLLLAHPDGGAQKTVITPHALPSDHYARMHALLEKTIFHVDVATLDIRFGEATARELRSLAAGHPYSQGLADAVADVAMRSKDVRVRMRFLRNVSLSQFLDGIRDNMKVASDAGILAPEDYHAISSGLPRWYAFLTDRGVRDGDQVLYRILGDTLHVQYVDAQSHVLLDQTDSGPERRLAVLGSYFVKGSDFRERLLASMLGE